MGRVYSPLGSCKKNFLLIDEPVNNTSTLPCPKYQADYFNAPGICLSFIIAPGCFLPFVAKTHQGGWIYHLSSLKRNRSILNKMFTKSLPQVRTSVEFSSPGCHYLPVNIAFSPTFQSGVPSLTSRSCFKAD